MVRSISDDLPLYPQREEQCSPDELICSQRVSGKARTAVKLIGPVDVDAVVGIRNGTGRNAGVPPLIVRAVECVESSGQE